MEVEDQPPPAQEADMASGDSSDTMNVDVDSSSGGGDEAAAPSGPPPRLMISKMVRFDLLSVGDVDT